MQVTIKNIKVNLSQDNSYGNEWFASDENYEAEHDGFDWHSSSPTGLGDTPYEALVDYIYNAHEELDDREFNKLIDEAKRLTQ